jgi:hypothetical protein
MTPSIRYFLANEQRELGHFADALGNADLCTQQAQREANTPNRNQVISECRSLVADLGARVGHVTLQVPTPAPQGLEIRVAGQPVSDAFWGAPFVVTPGNVMVDASAPGRQPFHQEIAVAAGASQDISIALEVNPEAASASPAPSSSPSPAPVASSASPSPAPQVLASSAPPPAEHHGVSPGGIALVVVGVLFLGGGAISYVFWSGAASTLQNSCGTTNMFCADTPDNDRANRTAHITQITGPVFFAVGGVAIIVGAIESAHNRNPHDAAFAPRKLPAELRVLCLRKWRKTDLHRQSRQQCDVSRATDESRDRRCGRGVQTRATGRADESVPPR